MNNREWLNTLSDEEYGRQIEKKIIEINNSTSPFAWGRKLKDWLSQPHETTADEDFAEIGFTLDLEERNFLRYKDYIGWRFEIFKEEIYFLSGRMFTLTQTDKIRTIAEKKRKEMGWK